MKNLKMEVKQTDCPFKDVPCSCGEQDECEWHTELDTPQTDCDTCRHYKLACELFSEVCKYEPTTQTETQNSNLTFENRTMLDCYNCKRYKSDDACVECRYEPIADTPQTDDKDTNVRSKDEPQKDCKKCKNYDRCKNNRWKCCVYEPKDEPQTDCSWK